MWNRRSFLVYVRVKLHGHKENNVNFTVFFAISVLTRLLLSFDTMLALMPGEWGRKLRTVVNTSHSALLCLTNLEPQEYVQANYSKKGKKESAKVVVKTIGISGGPAGEIEYYNNPQLCAEVHNASIIPLCVRFLTCLAGLAVAGLIFPGAVSLMGAVYGALLITVFYALLRPLADLIALPANLFLFGLAAPFTDALFVWWASAWIGGLSFTYMQGVAVALLVSAAFIPYSTWRQNRLRFFEVRGI